MPATRNTPRRRQAWFDSYLQAVLQREGKTRFVSRYIGFDTLRTG